MTSNDYVVYTKLFETSTQVNKVATKITKVNDAVMDIKLNTKINNNEIENIEDIKIEYPDDYNKYLLLQGLEEDLMEINKEINKSKKKVGKSRRKLNKDNDNKQEKCLDYIMVEINYKDNRKERYIISKIASKDFI